LEGLLPKTVKWFVRVGETGAFQVAKNLVRQNDDTIFVDVTKLSLPIVPDQSLYKSDPKRVNPASRIYTRSNKGIYNSILIVYNSSFPIFEPQNLLLCGTYIDLCNFLP